jgi:hypothetical protein
MKTLVDAKVSVELASKPSLFRLFEGYHHWDTSRDGHLNYRGDTMIRLQSLAGETECVLRHVTFPATLSEVRLLLLHIMCQQVWHSQWFQTN